VPVPVPEVAYEFVVLQPVHDVEPASWKRYSNEHPSPAFPPAGEDKPTDVPVHTIEFVGDFVADVGSCGCATTFHVNCIVPAEFEQPALEVQLPLLI
jgi:hypothetical protein